MKQKIFGVIFILIGVVPFLYLGGKAFQHFGQEEPAPVPSPTVAALPSEPAVSTPPPVIVPSEYVDLVKQSVELCPAVPADVFIAQIQVESEWIPNAKSPAGALGIAQFMKPTWKAYGFDANKDGKTRVFDPADALPSASKYNCQLLQYVKKVPGDPIINMLAAYNAGPGAVQEYGGIPPFPETEQYVDKVLDARSRVVPIDPPGVVSSPTTPSSSS